MVRVCGACLALLAFAVTLLRGLSVGNSLESTLIRAWWSLVIFLAIGLGTGWVAQTAIDEHYRQKAEDKTPSADSEVRPPPGDNGGTKTDHRKPARAPDGTGARARL